jgi:hypothetical protein
MPNTTNALDGGVFSHLKKLIKLHQGLAKKQKVKLIDEFLDQYNKKTITQPLVFFITPRKRLGGRVKYLIHSLSIEN